MSEARKEVKQKGARRSIRVHLIIGLAVVLILAGGQRYAVLAHLRVVAAAHLDDHLVAAGFPRRCNDIFGDSVRIEAGNILGDRAGEQLDVLRQIADMAAEHFGRPLIERGGIDPDLAAYRLPDPDQRAHLANHAAGRVLHLLDV